MVSSELLRINGEIITVGSTGYNNALSSKVHEWIVDEAAKRNLAKVPDNDVLEAVELSYTVKTTGKKQPHLYQQSAQELISNAAFGTDYSAAVTEYMGNATGATTGAQKKTADSGFPSGSSGYGHPMTGSPPGGSRQ
ncbi:hypothetical protein DdX_22112 [Ditylenchus destructor]|uniref:Uncharacterized protein n=1 Tax=Ditylenchus destructor TaxID=166010 RepID=A0AAD4QUY9_9BILA|nr:hypothetical protein DdX_22112 [Ditylenchus destructor]